MIKTPADKPLNLKLKIPPHDQDAEAALLGSIMLKPEVLHELGDTLNTADFYSNKNKIVWKAISKLHGEHNPIDAVSVSTVMKEQGVLDQIGGVSYLADLINKTPTAANAMYYAELVAKKGSLRRLIDAADQILELGYNEKEESGSVFDRAEQLILGLTSFSKKTYVTLRDTLSDAWERFDQLHKSEKDFRGVPTGFKDLDNLLSGFQKADLIILAARPSVGKTTFALDIARHVACRLHLPVAIFSLEMSSQQLVDRILAAESRVNSWALRTGKLTHEDDFTRIRDALDSLDKAPILIDDQASTNVTRMKSMARRMKAEHGLELIVVDYLQLMSPTRDHDSMVQQVTEISRALKGLARELEVPVLALSQLSRDVEKRGGKPRLSDLRDSGSIEQDADVVMFIHREDRFNEGSDRKNIAEILVEKHRNGPVGKVELYFDEDKTSFTSIEKGNFGDF
jgi:replicative DNA helicase